MIKRHLIIVIFLSANLVAIICPQKMNAQCVITQLNGNSIQIVDESSLGLKFIVNDGINDDLLGIQGICGVRLNFNHTQISDVNIELIAPDGSNIFLIGPATLNGTTASLLFPINHDILFIPDSIVANPDPSTGDPWTNNNPNWANIANYSGTYHPHSGSLENNFAEGPVSGIWEIRVEDQFLNDQGIINSVELIFCDMSAVSCQVCEADAGEYESAIGLCQGDALALDQWTANSTAPIDNYSTYYTLDSSGITLPIDENYAFSDLPQGTYAIHALSILNDNSVDLFDDLDAGIELDSLRGTYCFDRTTLPLILNVDSPDTVNIEAPFCVGEPTFFEGGLIRNMDTVITRLLPDCSEYQVITFILSTVDAQISMDTIILGCNNLFTRIDASGSDLGVSGEVLWFRNGNLIENESNLSLEQVENTGLFVLEIDDQGCISRDTTIVIFEFFIKSYDFLVDTITCISPLAEVAFAEKGITFSSNWNGPGIVGQSSNTESIMVDQPGFYTVSGLDTAGCNYSEMIEVSITTASPQFRVLSDSIKCGNEQATFSIVSNEPALSVTWIQGNAMITGVNEFSTATTDDVLLEVVGRNGCSVDTILRVGIDTNAVILNGFSDTLNCELTSIVLDPGIAQGNVTYSWSESGTMISNDPSITVNTPNLYTLIASTPNGCTDTAEYLITIDTISPLISFTQDIEISCERDSAVLNLEIREGAMVEWKYPDVSLPNNPVQVVYESGSFMVEILQPRNNCTQTLNLQVAEARIDPLFQVVTEDVSCNNPVGSFSIMSSENIEVRLEINGEDPIVTDQFEISDSADIIYFVKGENGCEIEGFTQIKNNSNKPIINAPQQVILDCKEGNATITPLIISNQLIDWYFINPSGDTIREDSFVINSPSTISIEAINTNGCISSEEVEVVQSVFSGDFDFELEDGMYCDRSEVLLDFAAIISNPNIESDWTLSGPSPSIFEMGTSVSLSGEGTFELTLIDISNGCSVSDTFELAITDLPFSGFNFSTSDETCQGASDGSIQNIEVNGGLGMIDISINGNTQSDFNLAMLSPDVYVISAMDEFGCILDTSIVIGEGSNLNFELGDDITLFPNEIINIDAAIETNGTITNLEWSYNGEPLDDMDAVLNYDPLESGLLTLFVANDLGCEKRDSVNIIKAAAIEDLIYIPNVIASSSQLGNDILIGSFSDRIVTINSFVIYDRWGNIVKKLNDILPGQNIRLWDGKIGSRAVSSGVYVYRVEVTLSNDVKEIGSGDITVME